jgi:hypothetical protein
MAEEEEEKKERVRVKKGNVMKRHVSFWSKQGEKVQRLGD